MDIPIYLQKSGENKVKLKTIVSLTLESGSLLTFQSQEYFSVDLDSHYYVKRKSPKGSLELWWIEFPKASELGPPYTYIAEMKCKFRDIADNWVSDE